MQFAVLSKRFIFSFLFLYIGLNSAGAQILSLKDKEKIRYEAKEFISEFEVLMNMLASPGLSKYDRDIIKKNSFRSSPNQIFLDNKVIIEDDIDPGNYRAVKNTKDLQVERYLNDLDLFYSKSSDKTISFSKIKTSDVKKKSYVFLEVYFESKFKGKHITINKPYRPTKRVATIIARKVGKKWKMLIGSIVFYNPTKHPFVTSKNKPVEVTTNTKEEQPSVKIVSRKDIDPVPKDVRRIRERIITLGANLGYGFVFNQASIGANAQVYLADYLAGEMLFNYFATQQEANIKRWSLDTNINYVFDIEGADKIPYALIGLNFLKERREEVNDDDDDEPISEIVKNTYTGLNLGAGMEFISQKNMVYFGQAKYTTGEQNHFLFTVGFRFKFKTQ